MSRQPHWRAAMIPYTFQVAMCGTSAHEFCHANRSWRRKMVGPRGRKIDERMKAHEALWAETSAAVRGRQTAISEEPNIFLGSLLAFHDAFAEPCLRDALHLSFVYGLGNYRGNVPARLKALSILLACNGHLVEALDKELAAQESRRERRSCHKAFAAIAAREGVPSPQFSSAI